MERRLLLKVLTTACYAHELGHVLAQSGKFGAAVNDLRHAIR